MTVLQRTDLTTSQKIQCAAAAVAGQHTHGSKTALSETYETCWRRRKGAGIRRTALVSRICRVGANLL